MARTRQRRRRLWDAYCFPGFRPQPTVHGVFGDPKARVIKLKRRSKKRLVVSRWAGTIASRAGCAICRVATRGFISNWRCGGSPSSRRCKTELIAGDANGLADFQLLRWRKRDDPAIYCAFDLLQLDGRDLRGEPIEA